MARPVSACASSRGCARRPASASEAGIAIEAEQRRDRFTDAEDLARRCDLRREELEILAQIGALGSLGLSRRSALWQVAKVAHKTGPLFAYEGASTPSSPLPEMSAFAETLADYEGTGLSTGVHPVVHLRPRLDRHGIVPAADLERYPHGERVRTAGSVIVRQRPGTAKGMLFLTLEDETGMSQAIVSPDLLRSNRNIIVGSPGLVVQGVVQKKDGTLSVKAERFWRLSEVAAAGSHDFH